MIAGDSERWIVSGHNEPDCSFERFEELAVAELSDSGFERICYKRQLAGSE